MWDHRKGKAVTQTAILLGVHKGKMVHPERFERPTPRFVVRYKWYGPAKHEGPYDQESTTYRTH